jgi:CubicO group peptidase (beta-lactamase class C family)
MDYKYLKIYLVSTLLFVAVIVTLSVQLNLFGADKVHKEIVSGSVKEKIDKIFYEDKANAIDSIMQYRAKKSYFNGNVLVAYKGDCIFNESFGYADLKYRKALKKNDIFQLASVSKQFTAMAIMILKEQNKLSYDDSVTKFIPEFPYPRMTIRMLLNHTSGLPNYYWLVEHHWKNKEAPVNEDVIKLLAEHKLGLYFTPGKRWDYSNTGYVVLASITERISGKNFGDFLSENIFQPLKMNNSFVHSSSIENSDKKRLIGYYYRGRRYRMIPETINDGTVGDKGVYSTTADLFKWDQALYNNSLVSDSTFSEAISTFKLRNKYDILYGFGFRIKKRNNKKVAYHHGKWNGFRTSILRYVEDTNTIIVLNHTSTSLNNTIIREIQNVLDNSIEDDVTHDVITSILDDGIEGALEFYYNRSLGQKIELDTLKIARASQILYDTNNPVAGKRLALFNEMYLSGELDTSFLNDDAFLKTLSLQN